MKTGWLYRQLRQAVEDVATWPLWMRGEYEMKPYLRIIGDVHGEYKSYVEIAQESQYSIQLGDMGFDYSYLEHLNSDYHKVIAGNHDNYTENSRGDFVKQTSHFLGDFGEYTIPDFGKIFFVRGGNSIDKHFRTEGLDWWRREELNMDELFNAQELYNKRKPNFVITHECPAFLLDEVATMDSKVIKPSKTALFFDTLFDNHRPDWWIFGHHHRKYQKTHNGCRFFCLPELGYLDFDKKLES